jgi:hypothetical protein
MHNVLVIDDAVDIETQNLIEQSIFSPETNWTFGRTVFYHQHAEVTQQQQKTVMGFTKSLARIDDSFAVPDLDLYASPLTAAANSINQNINKLMTARIQLQLPVLVQKEYGIPHTDGKRNFPYLVGIYYVNDSDGDTVLFKQTINDTTPEEVAAGKLEIDQTIPYKKGRIAIFAGDIYHASGKPKSDIRCIINYNFV